MPIYEYECEECHDIIEVCQSISDAPLSTCSSCSGPLKKLISMSSFQLKGGGWYADGYTGSSKNGASKSNGDSCPAKSSTDSSSPATSCPKAKAAGSSCNA